MYTICRKTALISALIRQYNNAVCVWVVFLNPVRSCPHWVATTPSRIVASKLSIDSLFFHIEIKKITTSNLTCSQINGKVRTWLIPLVLSIT